MSRKRRKLFIRLDLAAFTRSDIVIEEDVEKFKSHYPSYWQWLSCLHKLLENDLTEDQVQQAWDMWMQDVPFTDAAKILGGKK